MQKTGKIIPLILIGSLAVGVIIFSRLSYKICWNCSADDYFIRGSEYVCEERKSHRQTGLSFLRSSAEMGHIPAESALAELYCNSLPAEYLATAPEQKICLQRDVAANQQTGLSYFKSILKAVKNGKETDTKTLNNLSLLYADGFIRTDARGDNPEWLYEQAAASGSFQAMSTLAKLYHTNERYQEALQWFIQASESPTDFQSPLMVGDYYMYGKGSQIDYQKARNWYSKTFTRAKKARTGEEGTVRRQIKKLSIARLEMVERKLAEAQDNRQQVAIRYSLKGGVKHFIIFAADHPGESIGEVINNNGAIYAAMNENLGFADLAPESRQDNFSSMNEGMRWVLEVFAQKTHTNSAAISFDFILTDS